MESEHAKDGQKECTQGPKSNLSRLGVLARMCGATPKQTGACRESFSTLGLNLEAVEATPNPGVVEYMSFGFEEVESGFGVRLSLCPTSCIERHRAPTRKLPSKIRESLACELWPVAFQAG